ncbi:MAG: hypothetical protein ACRCXC_00240 [Legionella sp.]
MNKCMVVLLLMLGLTSCSAKNEQFYMVHPNELQQAISACPENQPQGITCQQLDVLAKRLNKLAYQLHLSPQGFGQKIMALQETIAKQHGQFKTERDNANLKESLIQNKRDLADHLAVVRWFESPTS